eukprot:4253772-Amphidinium_carterae.2
MKHVVSARLYIQLLALLYLVNARPSEKQEQMKRHACKFNRELLTFGREVLTALALDRYATNTSSNGT